MNEIKNCPICGSVAEMEKRGTAKQSMIIACTNCGCRMESGDVVGLTKPEHYAWNQRHADTELVEALKQIAFDGFSHQACISIAKEALKNHEQRNEG